MTISDLRRKERANVEKRLLGVHLRCGDLATVELRVLNISEFGLGVDAQPLAEKVLKLPLGKVYSGRILVGHMAAPVEFCLVHVTRARLGIEFVAPSDFLRGVIRQVFETELLGAALRPVESSGSSQVFDSPQGSRLELQIRDSGIERFSVRILGNSVKWDLEHGLRLIQNARSELVTDFLRNQLIRLVQSAEALDAPCRRKIEYILQGVIET